MSTSTSTDIKPPTGVQAILKGLESQRDAFKADVANRTAHLESLEAGEEKDRYGMALKSAEKAVTDLDARVASAQKRADVQKAQEDAKVKADADLAAAQAEETAATHS